jgi:ribosomal protein L40E
MASQATRQRKGAGVGPPKSGEALIQVSNAIADDSIVGTAVSTIASSVGTITSTAGLSAPRSPIVIATVIRNKYGTGPFDENWLNVDCCGLFCAVITYMLHLYGVYATCLILIPPWMSTISDNEGIRTISFMGQFHRTAFTLIALLAIYAHFKAMTTDPGAVPPDAQPIPEREDLETTNGNYLHHRGDVEAGSMVGGESSSHLSKDDDPLLMQPSPLLLPSRKKGKRICRRCNAFKPKRAHHCSICRRCIIKMDRTCLIFFLFFLCW